MELIQLIILALVQGITEFLPVSSSAHLILVPEFMAWRDQGLAIDVAVHLGSLAAVIYYLRQDLARILFAGLGSAFQHSSRSHDAKLFWYLMLASMPVLLTGFLARDLVSDYLRVPLVIAGASIGFGLLLWFADIKGGRNRRLESLTLHDAVLIGLAQILALIPGTSRAGITITAALLLGLERKSAARFSLLTAIPVILAAASYELLKLIYNNSALDILSFIVATLFSAISAFITIHFFLKFLDKIGMLPFVIYRLILGLVLIILFI